MKWKRWIVLTHRYLGLVLCILFGIWFSSGIVMMYSGYPSLRPEQRLAGLPELDLSRCCITPKEALLPSGLSAVPGEIRLSMVLDRPVYRFQDPSGKWIGLLADTGDPLLDLGREASARVASRFVGEPEGSVRYRKTLTEPDQWTLSGRVRAQMPLHRFDLSDPQATRVYVSPASGEVVQVATRKQRFLAWIGAIPHWIYPTELRKHTDLWRQLVLWLSGMGSLLCLSGIAVGLWQYRFRMRALSRTRSLLSPSPYRERWLRWHHYLGLVFGLFAFTWVFSGMLSLDPLRWSPGGSPTREDVLAFSGGPLELRKFTLSPDKAWGLLKRELAVKEMRLAQLDGKPYYIAFETPEKSKLIAADGSDLHPRTGFGAKDLVRAARALKPGARMAEIMQLEEYDSYYYAKERDKPLPVLRVKLDDPERTWYYLDPRTGSIALKSESLSRTERWLYNGLHSLDFPFLLRRRPLWDAVVIALSLGGLILSITGVVVSWRWLSRQGSRRGAQGWPRTAASREMRATTPEPAGRTRRPRAR
jgi:hypothetical protein